MCAFNYISAKKTELISLRVSQKYVHRKISSVMWKMEEKLSVWGVGWGRVLKMCLKQEFLYL